MSGHGKAREPTEEEHGEGSSLIDIDLGDLDFDLEDFDFDGNEPEVPTRIMQPRMDPAILTQTVHFDNAMELAEKIDLSGKTRTYAWVSGGVVFGDILEALWRARSVDIKTGQG